MASSISMPLPTKSLAQHLQEQQEPFRLDIYLLEKRRMKKSSSSEGKKACRKEISAKKHSKSRSQETKRRRGIPHSSRILITAFNKFACRGIYQKSKSQKQKAQDGGREKASKMTKNQEHIEVTNQLSLCNRKTWLTKQGLPSQRNSVAQKVHSSPPSQSTFQDFKLRNLRALQAAISTNPQRISMEDKQLSPVSVLEIPSDQVETFIIPMQETTPIASLISTRKAIGSSVFSTSICEVLVKTLIQKQEYIGRTEYNTRLDSAQYLKQKRLLMQTKQLLLDCVKEVIDTYRSQGTRQKHMAGMHGPEELRRIICDQINSWRKQSGDVKNITHLINLDLPNTEEQWRDFQPSNEDIGTEISNAIFEDIVTETIDFEVNG